MVEMGGDDGEGFPGFSWTFFDEVWVGHHWTEHGPSMGRGDSEVVGEWDHRWPRRFGSVSKTRVLSLLKSRSRDYLRLWHSHTTGRIRKAPNF